MLGVDLFGYFRFSRRTMEGGNGRLPGFVRRPIDRVDGRATHPANRIDRR